MNMRALAHGKTQRMLEKVRDSKAELAVVVAHSSRFAQELSQRFHTMAGGKRNLGTYRVTRPDGREVWFRVADAERLRGLPKGTQIEVDHYVWAPGVLPDETHEALLRAVVERD